ncbi:hypothetical protein I552_6313 [Mycobacterium xenopi 3993]|nr:hypothetical protein I552_6313 [Mycobacterium xenopi 3993]
MCLPSARRVRLDLAWRDGTAKRQPAEHQAPERSLILTGEERRVRQT